MLSDDRDAGASGGMAEGEAGMRMVMTGKKKVKNATRKGKKARRRKELRPLDVMEDDNDGDEDGGGGSESTESSAGGGGGGGERQREHPFVVTEPGEVARAKKNGLDYLFHLYEQCRVFLLQVQSIAKLGGHKSPTKVRTLDLAGSYCVQKKSTKQDHRVHMKTFCASDSFECTITTTYLHYRST